MGSRRLTERALLSDPPTRDQLAAARNAAARRFVGVEPPATELALAVGGGATSLRRISGGSLDRTVIGELLERLRSAPSAGARRPSSGWLRSGCGCCRRRSPILEAVCELVPEPLRIAHGGAREGLALEHVRGSRPTRRESS